MIASEGFIHLITDPAHWLFEGVTDLVIGGLFGAVVWPWIKRHIHRDVRHAEKHVRHQQLALRPFRDDGDVHE